MDLSCHRVEDESYVWPGIVRAFVPALRAFLKRIVILLLLLFDDPFQAYEPTGLNPGVIAALKEQQAGYAAVAISERVNAEEVQVERGRQNQGWNCLFLFAWAEKPESFLHRLGSLGGGHGSKPDPASPIWKGLDDIHRHGPCSYRRQLLHLEIIHAIHASSARKSPGSLPGYG